MVPLDYGPSETSLSSQSFALSNQNNQENMHMKKQKHKNTVKQALMRKHKTHSNKTSN